MMPAESLSSATVPDGRPTPSSTRSFPSGSANGDPIERSDARVARSRPTACRRAGQISPWTGDWYARADWEKAAGPELLRERRVQPPLRRRPAGRDRQARLPGGARHQHDLFQPGVLRPVAAQVRRQLVSSHRSVFRSRSERRPRADGQGDERPGERGTGRRPTSCSWSCSARRTRGRFA